MARQLYRKLVQESSDIATIIDTEGVITYVSPAVRTTLGYEPEELVGEEGYQFQHPDDRQAVADAIASVQGGPAERQVIQTRFRHADGSWCWIEATLQDRRDDDDIGGILVNSRDITKRKRRERQLQESAKECKTLLETVEDAIFIISVERTDSGPSFRFEQLSQSYEEQTGIRNEEVRGKTPMEVFGLDLGSDLQANYHRCVKAGEPITYQEEVPVETGARNWQTILTPVVTNGEVTQVIGVTRNVTEQVKQERQLTRQKDQLDEFASVVSHDLRNPLTVAQGRMEFLMDEYDSEHFDTVMRALTRMEELISDTLTLARQGRVVADPEPVKLDNLVHTSWQSIATEDGTIEIEDSATIPGDRSRLRHVFENLFRNAIEHGGTDVTVRVGIIGDTGFYVEDTGPGIPESDRESVFNPGHTSASGGTGFGLTIIKRIVEAHGWTVSITDGSDGGARFNFSGIPLSDT